MRTRALSLQPLQLPLLAAWMRMKLLKIPSAMRFCRAPKRLLQSLQQLTLQRLHLVRACSR